MACPQQWNIKAKKLENLTKYRQLVNLEAGTPNTKLWLYCR